MDQPEGTEILPGMAGKAQIISQPPQDSGQVGIEVPATAVFTGEDMTRSYVWVIDETNKTLSRREVEVGGLSRFGTRITSGLAPGEWIVTKGVHSVEQGETVRILEAGEQVASS
jgi:multidrug efflux pump subunit AcrA (membrane-fusion protein)